MARAALLLVLLSAYAAAIVRPVVMAGSRFDAVGPEARFVELAIGEQRFADALPVALELRRLHPGEPLAAYWLGTIYQGLGRTTDARTAWNDFERLAGTSGGGNAD